MSATPAQTKPKGMTMRQMCEIISQHWATKHGIVKTPTEIFEYSPHGELAMVWDWYDEAIHHVDAKP